MTLCIMVSFTTTAFAATTKTTTYYVNVSQWANVRNGAGTNYKVVAKVNRGDKVAITEKKNGWGKMSKGWISLNLLSTSKPTNSSTKYIRTVSGIRVTA